MFRLRTCLSIATFAPVLYAISPRACLGGMIYAVPWPKKTKQSGRMPKNPMGIMGFNGRYGNILGIKRRFWWDIQQ
jgi:hypothetical protein